MLGFLAVGFSGLFKGVFSTQKRATSYGELVDFESLVRITTASPQACSDSVTNLSPATARNYALTGGNPSIQSFPIGLSAQNIFVLGAAQPNFTVTAASFSAGTVMNSFDVGADKFDVVLAQLELKIRLSGQNFEVDRKFPVSLRVKRSVLTTPGVGPIQGCGQSASVTVTEWQNAGPAVVTSTATAPTKGTTTVDRVSWRRVGDSMEVVWRFQQTAGGTDGTGLTLFQLPAGARIDLVKLPFALNVVDSYAAPVGFFSRLARDNLSACTGVPYAYDQTRLKVRVLCHGWPSGGGGSSAWGAWMGTYAGLDGAGEIFLEAKVPIEGWGI